MVLVLPLPLPLYHYTSFTTNTNTTIAITTTTTTTTITTTTSHYDYFFCTTTTTSYFYYYYYYYYYTTTTTTTTTTTITTTTIILLLLLLLLRLLLHYYYHYHWWWGWWWWWRHMLLFCSVFWQTWMNAVRETEIVSILVTISLGSIRAAVGQVTNCTRINDPVSVSREMLAQTIYHCYPCHRCIKLCDRFAEEALSTHVSWTHGNNSEIFNIGREINELQTSCSDWRIYSLDHSVCQSAL